MSSHNTLPQDQVTPLPVLNSPFVKHDEIDLFEIFSVIVKARKFIVLVTVAFVIAGLVVGAILPQKWTSSSVIIAPASDEFMGLDDLIDELKVAGVDTGIDSNYLLSTYMRYFDSRILRDNYLQHSEYFKALMQENPEDQLQKRRLLDAINTNNITTFSSADDKAAKKAYTYYRLNFSAKTPEAAKNLLQGYIDYVEQAVRADIIFKIKRATTLKLQTEQQLFDLEMQKVQNARDVRIKKLKYALSIADAAGLKKPVYSNGAVIVDDPDYAISLGADALSQKLKVEESITDPLTMSVDLRNSKMRIDLLKNVKIDNVEFKPFKYLQKPEVPSKKDEPKRMIILVIFTVLGLMGAIAMALLHHLSVKRRERVTL
jgi:LPS O-antigen subunit length determinant protein (WzzB/FepE family)